MRINIKVHNRPTTITVSDKKVKELKKQLKGKLTIEEYYINLYSGQTHNNASKKYSSSKYDKKKRLTNKYNSAIKEVETYLKRNKITAEFLKTNLKSVSEEEAQKIIEARRKIATELRHLNTALPKILGVAIHTIYKFRKN